MNERIQELAYQAEDYADGIVDQGGEFHQAYTRKFAELIVQECCQMMLDLEVKYPANLTVREIKQHFGVEE